MQYLLLIHSDENAMQGYTPEETGSVLAAYGAYMKAMGDAGVNKGGQRLRPTSTAKTVRVQNGKTQVVNGPYAEVKELIAGYTIIDVKSKDEALEWTKRFPNPFPNSPKAEIEVRPMKSLDELGKSEGVERFRALGVPSQK